MLNLGKGTGLGASNRTVLTWSAPLQFFIKDIYPLLLSLTILVHLDLFSFILKNRKNYMHANM